MADVFRLRNRLSAGIPKYLMAIERLLLRPSVHDVRNFNPTTESDAKQIRRLAT
jgi:hypothetical protein